MAAFLTILAFLLSALAPAATPKVERGVLDLRGWSPDQGSIALDGSWDFRPGIAGPGREGPFPQQRPVPGFWSDGRDSASPVATYRLRILCGDSTPPLLALRAVRPSSQSIRVLVDGVEQGQFGRFGTSPSTAQPRFTTEPLVLRLPPGSRSLVLEVASFHALWRGIPRPMELGTPEQLLGHEIRQQAFNTFLAGCLCFLCLQFSVVWWTDRRHASTGLFALVCLFSLVRHLVTTSCALAEIIPGLDWEAHLRLEYLTFGTIILWVYWFTLSLFPRHLPRLPLAFLQASGAAYAFFSLIAPPRLLIASVWYYQLLHLLGIPLLLWSLIKAARHRERGAATYLVGFAIVAVTATNDILYALRIVQTGLWAPAGMLGLVVSLAIVASRRSAQHTRELTGDLEQQALHLASAWERRHPGFAGHQERVARLAELLARLAGLPPEASDAIRRGAASHDAGLQEAPDDALLASGPLSDLQRASLQRHVLPTFPTWPAPSERLEAQILRSHHEHWDGTGYPEHLCGESIPLAARIVAVADIWDALVHERPHRRALPLHDALAQMERERGRTLDPRLVDLFLEEGAWKLTHPPAPAAHAAEEQARGE